MTRLLGLLLLLPPLATAAADSATPLPDPLSLEQALELAGEAAPPLRRAAALRDRESALAARSAADDDLEILLQGRLRLIETPDVAPDDDRDDHWAGLFVRKRLYDFGRSDALDAAGRAQAESGEWGYLEARRAHRLLVLESFFDVLLADLAHAWRNEALAIAFIRADRSRDRRQLGQLSDLEVLEAESANAEALRRFAQAEAHQRATRQRLASALGRPHELPANLA
ncbi:MAG TPA: TolC family protein, partial [Gammaproteobacteria bacterium]